MDNVCRSLINCLVCEGKRLTPFLDLGEMPQINHLPQNAEEAAREPKYPLAVAFCGDCSHVQLTHALDPEDTFSQYLYFSSISDTFVAHGKELANKARALTGLGKDDLVVELASNDGALLQAFREHTPHILGIEPAKNVAVAARKRGIPTITEFFGEDLAHRLRLEHGEAAVIIATNVLAHVPDLRGFVRGIRAFLRQDGIALIEVPYLVELLRKKEFDTIYHEHLSYFRVGVLKRLFEECGLRLFDAERISLHGGSLLLQVERDDAARQVEQRVRDLISEEELLGLNTVAPYRAFAAHVEILRREIIKFLKTFKAQGRTLAAYGAAAKGNVLTNYCGLGPETFAFVADRSPYKQKRLTPGSHIPIAHPDEILRARPDYLVILAWNFKDEIMAQQHAYQKLGGRFVALLPEPKIIT